VGHETLVLCALVVVGGSMSDLWEEIYRKETKTYKWTPSDSVVNFLPVLKDISAHKVLDVGCGTGRNALFLGKEGFIVVGIDISKTALQVADQKIKNEGLHNIILLQGDIADLPFPPQHFDAIISTNVIHHTKINDIKKIVNEIYDVLCHDGKGLVTVVADMDYKFGKGRRLEENTYELSEEAHREKGMIHHFFNEFETRALFNKFEILTTRLLQKDVEEGRSYHWEVTFSKSKSR